MRGCAIGGGLELALACDLRVCAESATLFMPPAALGLVYSHTGVERFLRLIGPARTRELFLTGRRLDGTTAERWGLVNESVAARALDERAVALATRIAAQPSAATAGNKRVIRRLERSAALDSEAAADLERLRASSVASPEFAGAVRTFLQKRP
jgi:enoyl-CoA hydratase/carnithine racemase